MSGEEQWNVCKSEFLSLERKLTANLLMLLLAARWRDLETSVDLWKKDRTDFCVQSAEFDGPPAALP